MICCMLCPFTPLSVWMEIDLLNSSGANSGSIVGRRVGILGFGVGNGIFVPSGNTCVGNGIDKGSNCVGVDSRGMVGVGFALAVTVGIDSWFRDGPDDGPNSDVCPHAVNNMNSVRKKARENKFFIPFTHPFDARSLDIDEYQTERAVRKFHDKNLPLFRSC